MTIIAVKIGENEPQLYSKFGRLSKHLDIVDVLPRKRGPDGKLLNRTMGLRGDKEFLGLNVDMEELTDKELGRVGAKLKERWEQFTGVNRAGSFEMKPIAKRLRYLDLSPLKRSHIGLSDKTCSKLELNAEKRRNKQPYDMRSINKFNIVIPFPLFAKIVLNKITGQTLEEELDLTRKTIKQVVREWAK